MKTKNQIENDNVIKKLNGQKLAFIGDSVYERVIRDYVINEYPNIKLSNMQNKTKEFVSAKAHSKIFKLMDEENLLTEDEIDYFKKGRNSKSHTKAKNTDSVTYQISTGIESLIGFLYLSNQKERLNEIMNWIIEQVENKKTRK